MRGTPLRSGVECVQSAEDRFVKSFKSAPQKSSEPEAREVASLREMARGHQLDDQRLSRLQKLRLIEKKSDAWVISSQGHIVLMFASAR